MQDKTKQIPNTNVQIKALNLDNLQNDVSLIHYFLENIPSQIFWKDKDLHYRGCNKHFATMAGLRDPSEIIEKTDYDLPWHSYAKQYREEDEKVMRTKEGMFNMEVTFVNKDEELIYILVSKVPIINVKQEVIGVLGIYNDITRIKNAELASIEAKNRAEQAEAAKSEFIRNMSHDLRTPLAGIIGALNVLHDEEKDPKLKIFVEQSYDAATALLSTFNEILEVSKLEFNEIDDVKATFSIAALIQETAKLYMPVILEKDLELHTYIDESLPNPVAGNRRVLHRILLNLLGNAIKFTENGSITIEAKLFHKNTTQITVEINVKDTGIGIPKDKQEEIFLPFSRLTSAYKNEIKGSGLGLHIVKQFVQKMMGEITVTSAPNKGSVFTVKIPLQLTTENKIEPAITKTSTMSENHPSNNIYVLVVEDNLFAQRMAKANLENWGYKVDTANEGIDAIKKCENISYDLIFMDMGLPNNLDGCETTQIIKENFLNANTPVIALTAHADKKLQKECLEVGIETILEKPLTKEKAGQVYAIYFTDKSSRSEHSKNKISSVEDKSMLALFMERYPVERVALVSAIEAQDLAKIGELMHGLIGALSYCGAPTLLAQAKKIHQAAKDNDIEQVKQDYSNFEKTLESLSSEKKL
jgi:two-component system aerobic respiration control sensor histidine kinase ArcB